MRRILPTFSVLTVLLLGIGCGALSELDRGQGDLTGKEATDCYYDCIKKGVLAEKCKALCSESAKKTDTATDCYYGCIKKGIPAEKCKTYYCAQKTDTATDCYYGCIKKGVPAEKCKALCSESAKKTVAPGCKEVDGCKLCWDETGKIVKKVCPKSIEPGCKAVDGCKLCWDETGKIVKKVCPSDAGAAKECYYGCLKKGLSEEKCKAACAQSAKGSVIPGCKAVDGCKLCWDETGKIVKKVCPRSIEPGCKVIDGCKVCWDETGKIVKKVCPSKTEPGCKKYAHSDGRVCVECWDETGEVTKKFCE